MSKVSKYFIPIVAGVVLVMIVFGAGVFVGASNIPAIEKVTSLYNKEEEKPAEVDFGSFWDAWVILDEKFVPENGTTTAKITTDQEKVWGAIAGLTRSLGDPYTVYFPPKESEIFEQDISGSFEGVGMEIAIKDEVLTVVAPLRGSPAEKAGLEPGDRILEINGKSTEDLTVDEAVSLIRGRSGTEVVFTIYRDGENETRKVSVRRDVITIPTLETKIIKRGEQEIFVINLYNFSANSIGLFRKALYEFSETTTEKMIIDLRGNPGGYLEAAVDMASFFLPEGKVIVRERSGFGENEVEREHRSRGYDVFTDKLKLVILIDEGSASASEILAGALSEYDKGTLIGEKTFGKGSVQELVNLDGNGSIKITTARWFTPEGRSLSKSGLSPDILVEMTAEDREKGRDPQLERAIEYLLRK